MKYGPFPKPDINIGDKFRIGNGAEFTARGSAEMHGGMFRVPVHSTPDQALAAHRYGEPNRPVVFLKPGESFTIIYRASHSNAQ